MASPGCGELRYHLLKRYSRWARSSSGVTLTKRLKISGKRKELIPHPKSNKRLTHVDTNQLLQRQH